MKTTQTIVKTIIQKSNQPKIDYKMDKNLKIGLWIPPRRDLSQAMNEDNPGNIDQRLYDLYIAYLDDLGVNYTNNLDFRDANIQNHRILLQNGVCLNDFDHYIWMGDLDRHIDSYQLEVLRVLELSTKVHNPYSFYNVATDKFTAFSILHSHGIPVSELYLVSQNNHELLEEKFKESSFLIKPRRSSWGIGIIKVDKYTQLRDIIEYNGGKQFYLEKFYPNDMKDWLGLTVFNGTVLYGFRKRHEKIAGWKVYDKHQTGGQADYVKPSPEIEAIAKKIGEVLGANYFGLDLIKTSEGYKVVDINCHPGVYFDMIEELKLPIAELFFKMLPLQNLKRRSTQVSMAVV